MESEPDKIADESGTDATEAIGAAELPAVTPDVAAETPDAAAETPDAAAETPDVAAEADASPAAPADQAAGQEPEQSDADADADAAPAEGAGAEAVEAAPVNPNLKWYAVHTYSGHENKARLSLLDRIKNAEMHDRFGEVLIPTESVVEMVKGQRRTTTRKFYPGYMFVQMVLDDYSLHLVKNTPKITGFLGGNKPVPVKDSEIAGINRQMTEGAAKPKPRISFDEGENIRVTGGPFSNFTGIVEEVRPEKQKLRVLVSIFGRATPVELDFSQVEKTEE